MSDGTPIPEWSRFGDRSDRGDMVSVRAISNYYGNDKFRMDRTLDLSIQLWDTNSGALRSILAKNRDKYAQIVMSPDGNTLVSKLDNSLLHVWNLKTGILHATIKPVGGLINAYAFIPNSNSLISTDIQTRWIHKWNVETGKLQMKIKTRPD